MNNTIDHAILIPAYTKTVWQHLSNVEENPAWQADCERIAYLNSVRDQKGIRYRSFGRGNRESVVEITAWYPGLGYEYIIADGFAHPNRGRIRLQEVAEGTVVQWTFSYETSGLVGGLSNSLSLKRRLNNEVIRNLQALYQYIGQVAEKPDSNLIKSTMRDAPDASDRANYQPKYPSALEDGEEYPSGRAYQTQEAPSVTPMADFDEPASTPSPDEATDVEAPQSDVMFMRPEERDSEPMSGGIQIIEPPLSDMDTQPNPVVQDADIAPSAENVQQELPADYPATPETSIPAPPSAPTEEDKASTEQYVIPRPPFEPSDVVEEEKRATDEHQATVDAPVDDEEDSATVPTRLDKLEARSKSASDVTAPTPSPDSVSDDTSQLSVFELFGLQKPSETQEMRAIQDAQLAALDELEAATEEVTYEPVDRGEGIRIRLRKQSVKLKFPH
ncbi:MAG: hypothetical protein CL607_15135 [Anaerolineaceae bacterium]|nr:hypothetical protein [Anaerolineaceae bacterium]